MNKVLFLVCTLKDFLFLSSKATLMLLKQDDDLNHQNQLIITVTLSLPLSSPLNIMFSNMCGPDEADVWSIFKPMSLCKLWTKRGHVTSVTTLSTAAVSVLFPSVILSIDICTFFLRKQIQWNKFFNYSCFNGVAVP